MTRPPAWAAAPADASPAVAVLITGCDDIAAAVRGYRTVLPRARLFLYDHDLAAGEKAAEAGADFRIVPAMARDALVRRMLAEVDADIYILAHGARPEDVCVAPLVVAEVDGGKDLVDVRQLENARAEDAADRLFARIVTFAFGGRGDVLGSHFKAVSRRFALSYGRTAPRAGPTDASARDLALHALRLRLPVGQVAALGTRGGRPGPARDTADRLALFGLAIRLLVEERPRRVFGLLGVALVTLGLAVAAPELKVYRWHAVLTPGSWRVAAAALLAAGAVAGAAGVLLDTLASARQEVRRLGAAAIPRRVERTPAPPR